MELVEDGEGGSFRGEGWVFEEAALGGEEIFPCLVCFGGGALGKGSVVVQDSRYSVHC